MRIYFNEILYKKKTLFWDRSADGETYQCSYPLNSNPKKISKINAHLQSIQGIKIIDGVAVITVITEIPYKQQLEESARKKSPPPAQLTRSAGVRHRIFGMPPSLDTIPHTKSAPLPSTALISFELLLKSKRGATLCYVDLRQSTLKSVIQQANLQILGSFTPAVIFENIKSLDLHLLRVRQLELAKQFYDILLKLLDTFSGTIPNEVWDYLRESITRVMVNSTLNEADTTLERRFKNTQESYSPKANYLIRQGYAQDMLCGLLFFTDGDMHAPNISLFTKPPTKELSDWFITFKRHVALERDHGLAEILKDLEKLTVAAGLMAHDNGQLTIDTLGDVPPETVNKSTKDRDTNHPEPHQINHFDLSKLFTFLHSNKTDAASTFRLALSYIPGILPSPTKPYPSFESTIASELSATTTTSSVPLCTPEEIATIASRKFYSFNTILFNYIKNLNMNGVIKPELKHEVLPDLVNEIFEEVIRHLFVYVPNKADPLSKWIAADIKSFDKDFYLSEEFKKILDGHLNQKFPGVVLELITNPTPQKKISVKSSSLMATLIKLTNEFLDEQIKPLKPPPAEPVATSAAMRP